MGNNIFASLFISAFVSLVILFPIFIIRGTVLVTLRKPGKAVGLAKARGHVVTARLVKTHWRVPDNPRDLVERYSLGIYEYEYRGKVYRYKYTAMDPPDELTLYFVSNPRKAATESDTKLMSAHWGRWYLVIFAIVFVLVYSFSRGG